MSNIRLKWNTKDNTCPSPMYTEFMGHVFFLEPINNRIGTEDEWRLTIHWLKNKTINYEIKNYDIEGSWDFMIDFANRFINNKLETSIKDNLK